MIAEGDGDEPIGDSVTTVDRGPVGQVPPCSPSQPATQAIASTSNPIPRTPRTPVMGAHSRAFREVDAGVRGFCGHEAQVDRSLRSASPAEDGCRDAKHCLKVRSSAQHGEDMYPRIEEHLPHPNDHSAGDATITAPRPPRHASNAHRSTLHAHRSPASPLHAHRCTPPPLRLPGGCRAGRLRSLRDLPGGARWACSS